MRNSPEEYGAYIGFETILEPKVTEERIRKFGKTAANCHHLWWMARTHHDWLRAEKDFQPEMYIPAHNALHANCPPVPSIGKELLRILRADFRPTGDTLDSLDEILLLIDHHSKDDNIQTYDRLNAPAIIHALESQKYYLRGNIDKASMNYDRYVRGYK